MKKLSKAALKKRAEERRVIMLRAQSLLQTAMFDLHRMGFDLTNLLVYTSKEGIVPFDEQTPSDLTLHQLRIQTRDALKRIDQTIDLLRPYARKRLADPEGAFAALEKLRT